LQRLRGKAFGVERHLGRRPLIGDRRLRVVEIDDQE
jgi:hypothetical protein